MVAEKKGGETREINVSTTPVGSAPGSPRKVKFLCSHGGKILPRATDGRLKYIGGETRAISVPRDINFSELKKKLAGISSGGQTVLKYQVIPEDLEALVSVKTDEDIRLMIDEYDRNENQNTPKFRTFLFPSNPIILENHTTTPIDPQTRYVDAINGVIRSSPIRAAGPKLPQVKRSPSPLRISSSCSSPRSPESSNIEFRYAKQENVSQNGIPKVHSSPNMSGLINQPQPAQQNHNHHCYYPKNQLIHRLGHNTSPTGPQSERLYSVRSVGRADSLKYQAISSAINNYYPPITGYSRTGSTSSS